MTDEKAIHILEVNRDSNPNSPKFVEACNVAITAIKENRPLKNRCYVLSQGMMCMWCRMECNALGKPRRVKNDSKGKGFK